jgi:hypothetical protein
VSDPDLRQFRINDVVFGPFRRGEVGYDLIGVCITASEREQSVTQLLRDLAASAVESDTARNYVVVQIDRDTWNDLAAYRDT